MLDQRQFRDRTARPQQMLGAGQEQWFGGQLHGNASLWNLIGQGTMVSHLLERRDGEVGYSRDSWNGFPEARRRFVRSLQQSRARNPVILTGDIHAFAAGHLTATPEDPSSAVVAPEFVTTGISSNARPQRVLDGWLELNPNIRYGLGERRGYMRVHLDRDRLALDMVAVDDHRDLASACRPVRSFVVEAGRPGMVDDAH
jgi:alkaline phosphatase D